MSSQCNFRGGGGTFSTYLPEDNLESMSPIDPPTSSSTSTSNNEPPSVLFITTHGSYKTLERIEVPMNIKKINAVISGVCNYLDSDSASNMADRIIHMINDNKITEMDYGSILIQEILKFSIFEEDRDIRQVAVTVDKRAYKNSINRAYQITSVDMGQDMIDKTYQVSVDEKAKSSSLFFDTITLLTEPSHNDLIEEMIANTSMIQMTRQWQKVQLSQILKYIFDTRDIQNLIIIDLSCSATPHLDSRSNRSMNRDNDIRMGGYKRKTERNKKKNNRNKKNSKKHKKKSKKRQTK
jgi:hypothetical protein